MNNFDLTKFLVENKLTTRGRLMFEGEGANLVPLQSVGLFLDTEEKTLHPMKDDGTPDLDPGMAVDMQDANKEEIMANIDDADKEVLVSVSKELSETSVDEALNKPVDKLGPDVEKRLQSMGFETKVFPNPSWGNIPDEAIKAIEANPKLAGIAFVKNNSGTEAMRVMVNAERKKDLQKVRDYFQVPEENFGPAKELSWVTKQIQNINPGDWVASQAKVLSGSGDPVAVIDWFRTITKGASQTKDARGDVKMNFGQAAEGNLEEATDLHSDRGYLFTRFNGGKEKGKMLQINTPDRQYIQIPQGNLGNFLVALEKAIKAFDQ